MDTFWIPLVLAILGTAVGAYFAIIRTKREKLWSERYERIGSALKKADLINRFLDSEVNGEHQIHGLTQHEKDQLDRNWPVTRYELASDITMLEMLFTEKEFAETSQSWFGLQKKLFELIEESSSHDAHEYVSAARPHAEDLQRALIKLSRKKCLSWF
ncbi:hypothetical protein HMPREF3173_09160 [Pseudomonas sp. HMSC08G10]|uniref:hypothetical protein n=1 Tax=Pseudomonas sp. HMSC08G10 TaxID=1581141 RepID=UPI0008A3796C|nr:hypothetical protein [Pseudomonas sp. HMSC08G10]OFS74237.1 hypothetical protein HMPREF3173_09160 [Pseudomonas sp. HMSC08G10]